MGLAPHAFFMPEQPGRVGQRLCLYHAPQGPQCRGALVYVHPFAEEMNKSRRMAALQSRAFADAGFAVLQIDLLGCGDSSGDFADASWQDWIDDVLEAARWMRTRHAAPLTLWGLRAGCLLAAAAARQMASSCNLLFWQPALTGKAVLQQFLRVEMAGARLDGDSGNSMKKLRARFASSEGVEVAGYRPSAALAQGLDGAILAPPPAGGRVAWLEISLRQDAALLPASAALVQRWLQAGCDVSARVVSGPGFWQTVEIEEAPALIDATLATMTDTVAA